jgi:hypothetical protein
MSKELYFDELTAPSFLLGWKSKPLFETSGMHDTPLRLRPTFSSRAPLVKIVVCQPAREQDA